MIIGTRLAAIDAVIFLNEHLAKNERIQDYKIHMASRTGMLPTCRGILRREDIQTFKYLGKDAILKAIEEHGGVATS